MKKFVSVALAAMMLLTAACGAAAVDPTDGRATVAPFTDVFADADYAAAVEWCYKNELMNGVSDTEFDPNGELTRAMVATVLYRAEGEPAVDSAAAFSDVPAGVWYSDAVAWANASGLMIGHGDDTFGPEDAVTREQLNIVIGRYNGEDPAWTGAPELQVSATRAEVAVALMQNVTVRRAASTEPSPEPSTEPTASAARVLVAYFSFTGNTDSLAHRIATATGGELFEIVPAEPYPADTNNYYDESTRAYKEQHDPSARPAVASLPENIADCDVLFVGYPIWYGLPPRIVLSFLESLDLAGKTVVPFCTSGSSPLSVNGLREAASGATLLDGRRFSASASQSEVDEWVSGLDIPKAEEANTMSKIKVSFNGTEYSATLADNSSAVAFAELLRANGGSLTVATDDYGNFEKVGDLGATLPRNDEQITTSPGDVILYLGTSITLYYDTNSWSFTRLGRLDGEIDGATLRSQLGSGRVDITFAIAE